MTSEELKIFEDKTPTIGIENKYQIKKRIKMTKRNIHTSVTAQGETYLLPLAISDLVLWCPYEVGYLLLYTCVLYPLLL